MDMLPDHVPGLQTPPPDKVVLFPLIIFVPRWKCISSQSMVSLFYFLLLFFYFHGVLCLLLLFLLLGSKGYSLPRLPVLSSGCFHSALSSVLRNEAGTKQHENYIIVNICVCKCWSCYCIVCICLYLTLGIFIVKPCVAVCARNKMDTHPVVTDPVTQATFPLVSGLWKGTSRKRLHHTYYKGTVGEIWETM